MQSEQVRSRFGRCPYCRAMIIQDPNAIIFYCSKCRTPIRGKNPQPTDETEYALAQLEILSADTASVFSDDVEPPDPRPAWAAVDNYDDGEPPAPVRSRSTPHTSCKPGNFQATATAASLPYKPFGSVRTGPRSYRDELTEGKRGGSPLHSRVAELRPPSSQRTRRSMSGEVDAPSERGSGTDWEYDASASAAPGRRRASPLSSQELDASTALSGLEQASVARSPLSDPAFQQGLLQALDNLRRVIAAVDQPRSMDEYRHAGVPGTGTSAPSKEDNGGTRTITRRSSRLMRRLESQLAQALPADRHRRDGSTSSSSSSSSASSSRRGGLKAWAHHCRPVLGGSPFVLCNNCSEILQLPAALPLGKVCRLQCGGCAQELEMTLPASGSTGRPKKIFSAPQPAVGRAEENAEHEEYAFARSSLSGEQGPLHRVLGYSSVSSVLRSRRYSEHN